MTRHTLIATVALAALSAVPLRAMPADTTKRDSMKTVIGGRQLASGGYGGPVIQFGRVAGDFAVMMGGEGAWVLGHRFLFGGRGVGLATENTKRVPPAGGASMPVSLGYGGLLLGYIARPNEVVHTTFSMLFAAGSVGLKAADGSLDNSDVVGVFEPSAAIEVNLVRILRVDFGVTYRYVVDASVFGMGNTDFDGVLGQLVFRIGGF